MSTLLGAGFVLFGSLFFLPEVAHTGTGRWLVIYLGAAGAVIWSLWQLWRTREFRITGIDALALGFAGWCALSLLWSSDHLTGTHQILNIAALTAVFLLIRHCRAFDNGIHWGYALAVPGAVALGLLLPSAAHGGFGNENFISEFILCALPIALWSVWRSRAHRVLAVSVMCSIGAAALYYLFAVSRSNSEYAVLAAFGLAGVGWLIYRKMYVGAAITALGGFNVILYTPALWRPMEGLARSLTERAELWTNTLVMWTESPVWGHGLGSFNAEYHRLAQAHVEVIGLERTLFELPTVFAGSAHNDWLQLFAELGVVGALIVFALLGILIGRAIAKRCPLAEATSLCTLGVLAVVGFPSQMPATALLLVLVAGLALQRRSDEHIACLVGVNRLGRVIASGLATGAVAALIWAGSLFARSEVQAGIVRAWIDNHPIEALKANIKAHQLYPPAMWPRIQLILSLGSLQKKYPGQVVVEDGAADRIFEISKTAGEHNPGTLLSRVQYLINSRRFERDEAALDELEKTLALLKANHSLQADVWTTEAFYSALIGDEPRFYEAWTTANMLPGGPEILAAYNMTAETIQ